MAVARPAAVWSSTVYQSLELTPSLPWYLQWSTVAGSATAKRWVCANLVAHTKKPAVHKQIPAQLVPPLPRPDRHSPRCAGRVASVREETTTVSRKARSASARAASAALSCLCRLGLFKSRIVRITRRQKLAIRAKSRGA